MKIKSWVLLRGLTRSEFHWFGFNELVRSNLNAEQVLSLEIPGNGFLNKEVTPASIDELIKLLKKQVAHSSQPIGLIGISLGGMIAARWAELYPNQISALVVINTSLNFNRFYDRFSPKCYLDLIKLLMNSPPEQKELIIMNMTSNNPSAWKNRLSELTGFQKNYPVSFKSFMNQIQISREAHVIKKPISNVLILTSKADRLVNSRCSEEIAQHWQAQIKIHSWAGHDLTLDDPEWVIQQIGQFNASI